MIISILEDRPILKYKDEFYFLNYSDFIKYGAVCDHLIYLASVEIVEDERIVANMKSGRDFPNVTIKEVTKSPLKELIHFSSFNRKQCIDAIDKSDLVIIKIPSITIGKWAYNYLKKTKNKYILEVIGCAWDSFWNHSLKGKLIAPYSFYYTRKMVRNAPYVVYVSNVFLEKRYPTKGKWIGCSNVLLNEPEISILEERLKKIEGFDIEKEIKIGTVGAISSKYKGHKYAVSAIYRLNKEGYNFHYYLAGGGKNKKLKQLVHSLRLDDKIHFLGAVPRQEMAKYYDSLDIYIHPSFAEGLPRVVLEAERQALPVCGARAAGTPELVDERFVFKKKSSDAIYKVLKLFSKEQMIEQSKKNFERSKLYTFDKLTERRRDFYNMVLNDK